MKDIELFNDHFQNYKVHNIPKAQLIIADIPYNIGVDAYASNPSWYKDGDNKNGESELAGKEFFDTDKDFRISEFLHFCSQMLKKEPKQTGQSPCMIVFCSFEQQFELIEYIQQTKNEHLEKNLSLIVVVEASWLIQGNWHLSSWERKQRAASKGYDVGRNHETGRKIVEMCKYNGVEVLEHYPLRKCWKGKDGKITHEELASFTGIRQKTNQDVRDAVLLAWMFSGLSVRVKK